MENTKMRKLPKHVDGRFKVGMMPWRSFLIYLPIAITIIVITLLNFSPVTLFIGIVALVLPYGLLAEIGQRETGLDILKDMVRYQIQGDQYFERSCLYIGDIKRYIQNNIPGKKDREELAK